MCQTQVMASDLPIYNIFVPQKVLSKISDNVITCGLDLPSQSKILATLMAQHARIAEKGSNFLDPLKEILHPLEQRSNCGTSSIPLMHTCYNSACH